jgi:hypothetical protein
MPSELKPQSKQLVFYLVTQAGVDTSDWANYPRPIPASNPKYCYNWSFEGTDRVVVRLWFQEMEADGGAIFQRQNYRETAASPRHWKPNQRKRAAEMDHANQLARNKRLPIRVIVVDGSCEVMLMSRLAPTLRSAGLTPSRGTWPRMTMTAHAASSAALGLRPRKPLRQPSQARERSVRLRDLARKHFAAQSPDGRLHCAACDWASPANLILSSPIVEIHHGIGIRSYPNDGTALTFEVAIKLRTPLCPTCHRVLHAKRDGGSFTLEELRRICNRPS